MGLEATNSPPSKLTPPGATDVGTHLAEADSSFVVDWALERPEETDAKPAEQTFSFEFHLDDRRAVVLLNGALDTTSGPKLRECLDLLIGQGPTYIDLNVAEVHSVAPEVVGIFLEAGRRLADQSGKLRILRPQPTVASMLEQAGVPGTIEVIQGRNFEKNSPPTAHGLDTWDTMGTKVETAG